MIVAVEEGHITCQEGTHLSKLEDGDLMCHVIPEMVDSNPHTKRTETFTAPESGFL